MKKIFSLCSILCLILWLAACGDAKNKDGGTVHHRTVHGTAATGAYMPNGSIVQIRPAPIPTGQQTLLGTAPNGVETWVTEKNSAAVIVGQVSGNQGVYTIDVTGSSGPYLIRIQDPVSLKWYYSYADGSIETANVNPYTDWMVRAYYFGRWFVLIDDCFSAGAFSKFADGVDFSFFKTSYGFSGTNIYWPNMPVPMPDNAGILRNMSQLQYIINLRWGVNIGDVLTRDWAVGDTYDSILDGTTLDADYIGLMLADCFFADDMMDHGVAYYNTTNQTLHVELWTPYEYCRIEWPGIGLIDWTPTETVNGLNHYVLDAPYSTTTPRINFRVSDKPLVTYDPGIVFNILSFTQ
jgi:hypothetical protein